MVDSKLMYHDGIEVVTHKLCCYIAGFTCIAEFFTSGTGFSNTHVKP